MNWRAIGCGTLAAAAFVGIGIIGISRSFPPSECPTRLPYQPGAYDPTGQATAEARLNGRPLEPAGRTAFGLASWVVWVERDVPAASGEPLPERIVLECGDGTFQAYERPAS